MGRISAQHLDLLLSRPLLLGGVITGEIRELRIEQDSMTIKEHLVHPVP